jgi:hypothetical protein
MYRLVVANAFSLSMMDRQAQVGADYRMPTPIENVERFIEASLSMCEDEGYTFIVHSIVGHKDTASVFSHVLGFPVEYNRETFKLQPEDDLLVGQYVGPRLEEGATALPEGATIEWWLI